jgi:bacillithiol biosynthesis deacetylase BshB1
MVDILALAAHPDDVEQTCGGTLIRMAEKGYRTGVVDLTAGEMGTRGTPEQRLAEAEAAAREMLVAERHNLRLPDARLENHLDARMKIAAKIRELRPRVVILPYGEARHPDHARASELGLGACFLAGLRKLDLEGEPHRPTQILYASSYAPARPSFVVDISAQLERRMRALLCYQSQYAAQAEGGGLFPEQQDVAERLRAVARQYGMLIQARYGEPFVVKEMLRVEDIGRLGVASM